MKITRLLPALLLLVATKALALDYPAATRDSILRHITGASMPTRVIDLTRLGAKTDGKTDARPAMIKALRQARKWGRARIVLSGGVFLMCGPIHLVDGVCLDIREGATLRFSPEPRFYLPTVATSWEGTFLNNYSPMIYGRNLHDVSIVGKGLIDGNCAATFATWRARQKEGQTLSRRMNHEERPLAERNFGEGHWLRPQLIQLFGCRNVTIEGVKIINSPFWCIHLLQSENVICRGLRYDAKLVNNDGIDPESSRNVLIEDVSFDNGDDNVAIKSGRDNDGWTHAHPSENIIIRRCRFKGLHAVVIGSEMSGGVRNVFVEDCDFAGYCKRGLYIKTNPDRGGYVKNIYMKDCRFDEVEDLIYVTSMYAGEGLGSRHFSEVEHLLVDGVSCRKARAAGIVLQGTKAKPIRDVTIRRVEIGEVKNAVSIDDAVQVTLEDCHLGGKAGVPTQVTDGDRLFER